MNEFKTCKECNRNLLAGAENFPLLKIGDKSYYWNVCNWCAALRYSYNKKKSGYGWRFKQRLSALLQYSDGHPKCKCCGVEQLEFLGLDHIDGGGNAHRKEVKRNGNSFYNWLKRNNYPTGLQVLCHNCNMAKGFYGRCPHETNDNQT